jgi:hypothetical protein
LYVTHGGSRRVRPGAGVVAEDWSNLS